jgi:2,3,4,5-tetrahydropyridine-2-carboxylate N-succinyltransferase
VDQYLRKRDVTMSELAQEIDRLYELGPTADRDQARETFAQLRHELSTGRVRAAEPDASSATGWSVNTWVKKGILVGFRAGATVAYPSASSTAPYLDKDTLPLKSLNDASGVRLVPGGSSIRDGAYVGPGVICMPPMYINIGAYVGADSLIDSHALVGSCAQIGARVHVSAGAQIGGVLEPVGAMPVIVEDDALVGGNTGLYEGTVVRRRAVIGAGTVLTGSTPIFDLPRGEIITSQPGVPTVIPEGAVVVPGARAVTTSPGSDWGVSLATPIIIKYRDNRTDTRTELEAWIR